MAVAFPQKGHFKGRANAAAASCSFLFFGSLFTLGDVFKVDEKKNEKIIN